MITFIGQTRSATGSNNSAEYESETDVEAYGEDGEIQGEEFREPNLASSGFRKKADSTVGYKPCALTTLACVFISHVNCLQSIVQQKARKQTPYAGQRRSMTKASVVGAAP